MIVPVIGFCEYILAEQQIIPWISLIVSWRKCPSPFNAFKQIGGREFFAVIIQERLKQYGIKFRPNEPASPHMNGNVERSQKTDKIEFYSTIDLALVDLDRMATLLQLGASSQRSQGENPHGALL